MNRQDTRWDRRDTKRTKRRNDMARDGKRQEAQRNAILKRLRALGVAA